MLQYNKRIYNKIMVMLIPVDGVQKFVYAVVINKCLRKYVHVLFSIIEKKLGKDIKNFQILTANCILNNDIDMKIRQRIARRIINLRNC